jgi:hypothetical protein
MVSEDHSSFDHGCIPAHEIRQVLVTVILLQSKLRDSNHRCFLIELVFFPQQSTIDIAAHSYNHLVTEHLSYDKISCPFVQYQLPKVITPDTQFTKYIFHQMTGFWPEQVQEICQELILIPDIIRCRRSGCSASKELAIFVMLRRWHIADKWEVVSKEFRWQRSWCILIHHEIFCLVVRYYRKCVRVHNYRGITPLLEEWHQKMHLHCGTDPNVIVFTGSKPWKMSHPCRG